MQKRGRREREEHEYNKGNTWLCALMSLYRWYVLYAPTERRNH
jgi:hypothetical protein